MSLRSSLLLLLSTTLLLACQPEHPGGWDKLELLSYGLPVSVYAPDSAKILSKDMSGLMRDVSIRKGEDYFIQIFSSPASTNDIASLKAEQLELVRDNPYFKAIIGEDPDGFIFELSIDGRASFGFRHVRYQGNQEYIFQSGMSGLFTEAQSRVMYDAVRMD
jgi:hypothetical protein